MPAATRNAIGNERKKGMPKSVDQNDGDVAARHGEGAVREIDEVHQSERDREPGCQHEQQHAIGNSIEQNCEHVTAAKSARSQKYAPNCTIAYQAFPVDDLTFDKECARRRFGRRAL